MNKVLHKLWLGDAPLLLFYTDYTWRTLISQSIIAGVYEQVVDRDMKCSKIKLLNVSSKNRMRQRARSFSEATSQGTRTFEQQKEEERAAKERAKLTQWELLQKALHALWAAVQDSTRITWLIIWEIDHLKSALRDFISLKFFMVLLRKLLFL